MFNIVSLTSKILQDSKLMNFSGQDPFDGLNGGLFEKIPILKKGIFGLCWIQLHKRSFINLRRLTGVPDKRNPKGIGLFILGLLEDYKRTNDLTYLNEAIKLGEWLLLEQCDRKLWSYSCWGYHFDWNARAFYVPKGKPNIITTVYVSRALYDLGLVTGDSKFIEPALDSVNFIVKTLYTEDSAKSFFAYIPGEKAFVHNASLWGAAWVSFVSSINDDADLKKLAIKVARQSTIEQKEDGSWTYGLRHHHQFVDGFHTGYNLEALDLLQKSLCINEFDQIITKGFKYYKEHLISKSGVAKYYHDNEYPLDMHSVSQAIFTLIKVGGTEADYNLAKMVINKSIETLYIDNESRFVYQKHKLYTNKIDYIRWTRAWVYYSFSFYNNSISNENEKN